MPTIDHALQRFLELESEQRPDQMEGTELAIDNLRSYLESYGYQYVDDDLDDEDEDYDEDDYDEDEDFTTAHDTQMLPAAMAEFLFSWNIRTFMGTAEDARATSVTIGRLMELLAEKGWADPKEAAEAAELSRAAAEELPQARQLSDLLYDLARATAPAKADEIEDDVDDFLIVERIEPGRLWFNEDVGPIEVPEEVSRLAQVGWWVNLAVQRRAGTWFITETGSVYPRMIEADDQDEDAEDGDWGDLFPGKPSLN